ncbi:MAG: hypothetical protein Q4E51_03000 [Lachnospiraceae bacterium]|nr:hypothetical protein [Lachnospiraceae bacterium]
MGKITKLLTVATIAGAAGAGVYYYLNKKDQEVVVGDEADDTFSEATKDVKDFFNEKKEAIVNSREYVQLNKTAKDAKDVLTKAVKEAAVVINEKIAEAKDGVGVVADDDKEKAEDFAFEEFEEATEEACEAENTEKEATEE